MDHYLSELSSTTLFYGCTHQYNHRWEIQMASTYHTHLSANKNSVLDFGIACVLVFVYFDSLNHLDLAALRQAEQHL